MKRRRTTLNSASKKLVVGVDEAGYGPSLGPLVIAASVWKVPEQVSEQEFCNALQHHFSPKKWSPGCKHIPLGDSKALFHHDHGLCSLESGLLAMIVSCQQQTHGGMCWPSHLGWLILDRFQASSLLAFPNGKRLPWYHDLDRFPIPSVQAAAEVERLGRLASRVLRECDIQLVDLRAFVICEQVFNTQVHKLGTKAGFLSQATLGLVASLLAEHQCASEVYCDRQGGRTNYLPVLADTWPDDWFWEVCRSRQRCTYRNSASNAIEIHFSVRGDSFPATGLASMVAKYLRERLMESFNEFWKANLPDIKPTAGYPVDAQRFRREICHKALELGLEQEHWWRFK